MLFNLFTYLRIFFFIASFGSTELLYFIPAEDHAKIEYRETAAHKADPE